jgi:hypothetical protein
MSRRIGRDRRRRLCPQCLAYAKMKDKSRCRECWNANQALYDYWRLSKRDLPVGYNKPRYVLTYEMRRRGEVA